MSETYRKWGRVARWDHGVLVRVDESGESYDSATEFRVAPLTGEERALPEADGESVECAAERIVAMIAPPLSLERLIVTEGVALHQLGSASWQERTRRLHVSVARPPFRMLIDAASFDLDRNLLDTFARMATTAAPPPARVILAPPVTAAFLPLALGALSLEQAAGERDGKGLPILESPVTAAPPPNWYRPSYRVRPVRSWLHLRAVPFGDVAAQETPRAVALLSFPMPGGFHALCVEGGVAAPRWISPGRVLAAGPPSEWYPYGAGSWGAEILLESSSRRR